MRQACSLHHVVTSADVRIEYMWKSYGQPDVGTSGFAVGLKEDLSKLDARSLAIFLSNRQIYREDSEVFYACNKFDFGCSYYGRYCDSLPNALGFLKDRPGHALKHLKSIRLALGTTAADEIWKVSWPNGHELHTLCHILGNRCQLAELSLGIFGTSYHGLYPCLKQLYRITRLRRLNIWIQGCTEGWDEVENSVASIRAFRSNSLIGGDEMGEDGIDVQRINRTQCRVSTWKPERRDGCF